MTAETHFVEVACNCPDIEHCDMERYISDVRIAFDEIERLSRGTEPQWPDGELVYDR